MQLLKSLILNLPLCQSWPHLHDHIEGLPDKTTGHSPWDLMQWAWDVAGRSVPSPEHTAAALVCSMESIRLVDDLLDEDSGGKQHQLGIGNCANLALGLQAMGQQLIHDANYPEPLRLALSMALSRMMADTALGQYHDANSPTNEALYWEIVALKTPPLFQAALQMGAILGGMVPPETEAIRKIGISLGHLIQISDDLHDVLQPEPGADWQYPERNLALLFGLQAEHPYRTTFQGLLGQWKKPRVHQELQQLLIESGAISYGIYHMAHWHKKGLEDTLDMPPVFAEATPHIFERFTDQIIHLLSKSGIPITKTDLLVE